jgi:hypothetical protein
MKIFITFVALLIIIIIAVHALAGSADGNCPGLSECPSGGPQVPGAPEIPHIFDDPVR